MLFKRQCQEILSKVSHISLIIRFRVIFKMVAGINDTGNKTPVRYQKSAKQYILCSKTIEKTRHQERKLGQDKVYTEGIKQTRIMLFF
jgi:hypothetical protein